MNRRTFFSAIAVAVIGCYTAVGKVLPKMRAPAAFTIQYGENESGEVLVRSWQQMAEIFDDSKKWNKVVDAEAFSVTYTEVID